ncbi:MAG: glycoside hydrolase family 3 N-terminal domain-containing protein [Polaribacter sp.]|nr:glycoside hydrolase family 3 N-terminal domain-containing protein [Polaribacter sp.]
MKKKLLFVFCIAVVSNLCAQSVAPLRAADFKAQQIWVDSLMTTMTIDQKIGQLFMVQAYSNLDQKHEDFISELIRKYHVGNLIFMQGTPTKQAVLTNKYQALSKVPLLIGIDGEWGLDMRLKNTFRYPWNMTLGAIQENSFIEQFGQRVGAHCKRLGIHINFAPVVDINTNPDNPIIGNRSFGENKMNVTDKSIAFTKGMQSVGVLANAKHFPGHGDTATDSHHTLPVVNFDAQRLDTLELYPYKKMFDAGVASVMTAHLSIPKIEPNAALPSSLSPKIVTDLLKVKMGFLGLIITDGLNMKGAANYSSASEIDLAAILAGNDLLLIPQDVPESVQLMKNALKTGVLTEERLDFSVRKILAAKYVVGLHDYQPVAIPNLHEDLNTVQDAVLHRKLVEKSLTVIKNEAQLLPIRELEKQQIAYVALGDDSGEHFVSMLKQYAEIDVLSSNDAQLNQKLKPYSTVIVGFHTSNLHPWKSYKFRKKDRNKLQEIARTKRVILSVFASPYSLLQVRSFTNIESIVVAYQNSRIAQELTAQLIFGAITAQGKLPVSIKKEFPEGLGLLTSNLYRLGYSIPEDVGLSSEKLKNIEKTIDTILKEKMAPGAQVLVARKGKVVYLKSFGHHTNDQQEKVKNSDLYDVASLTKILASLPLIMKAEEEGVFSLNSTLKELLPFYKKSNKDTLTVKEMLSHNGRLKSWIPFYKGTQDSITGANLQQFYSTKKTALYKTKVAENLYLRKNYKDSIYAYIKEAPQREAAGYKYSDLGYYIFKEVLEKKYKKSLAKLADETFYQALGAHRMTYLPLHKFNKKEIIPTEQDRYFRNQLLHGNVHDMGAAMLGGIGGHAGLFSNANDIAKMMQMYLQKGFYGGKRYLKTETITKFNKRYFSEEKVRRGLGFDKPQLDPEVKATCGCVSEESFGHSGFTGTYTWADPVSGIVYIFLSNRVYPTMENDGLVQQDMRTKIQQIIQNAIIN